MTHPTLDECKRVGEYGGMPDTPEERARFEAYMRGHCWGMGGPYNHVTRCYRGLLTRMLYGVWRDRGALQLDRIVG